MKRRFTPSEIALAEALLRQRYVWSNFVHNLCHNLYPEKVPGTRDHTQFDGTPEERLFEIFKIMDNEVRFIKGVIESLDGDKCELTLNAPTVFDDISAATGITEKSHNSDH